MLTVSLSEPVRAFRAVLTRFSGNEKDIARDLLLFITAYLPLHAGEALPSELLPRHPTDKPRQPVRADLHVVSHSLGAQAAMIIAAHAPDLFSSLAVFDPAMIPPGKVQQAFFKLPKALFCTGLPYTYASHSELKTELRHNRRTRQWDEQVMELFVEHGTIEAADGTVRLIANPRLEWALYYDQETPTQCSQRMSDIRVPLLAVMPPKPFAIPPKMLEQAMAEIGRRQKARLAWVPGTTHQLPLERVGECAEHVVNWLGELGANMEERAKL